MFIQLYFNTDKREKGPLLGPFEHLLFTTDEELAGPCDLAINTGSSSPPFKIENHALFYAGSWYEEWSVILNAEEQQSIIPTINEVNPYLEY